MARPKFSVQHFIACVNAAWEGIPGPRTPRTLEGVIHTFGVPPAAEPAFEFPELWLYVRLFRTNDGVGHRDFSVRLVWLDAPGGARSVFARPLSPVRLSNRVPVANAAWPVRAVRFPGLGQYEFILRTPVRRLGRVRHAIVAREYVRLERQP